MTHLRDLCTCGCRRFEHKNSSGLCRNKHDAKCEEFVLGTPYPVISNDALIVLNDLAESAEPLSALPAPSALELNQQGFVRFEVRWNQSAKRDDTWACVTPAGVKFAAENHADQFGPTRALR